MNWQSIETAPKDGTEIIAMYMHIETQIVHNAFYMTASDFADNQQEYVGWWSYDKSEVSRVMLNDWMTPTHWMPLPDAPENNQPKGNENEATTHSLERMRLFSNMHQGQRCVQLTRKV